MLKLFFLFLYIFLVKSEAESFDTISKNVTEINFLFDEETENKQLLGRNEDKAIPISLSDLEKLQQNLLNSFTLAMENINTEIAAIKKSISDLDRNNDIRNKASKTRVGVYYKKSSIQNSSGNEKTFPKSCKELLDSGVNISGIYQIQPNYSQKPIVVLCDMTTRGGGWTHIQKRFDGSQDFFLDWRDYKFGFGDLEGEFWLGLENIYKITGFESNELLVELVDKNGKVNFAYYGTFGIGSEWEGYPLNSLGNYSGDAGDAGDALKDHLGQKFSTKDFDRDNDSGDGHCAEHWQGAWWYNHCFRSSLNGKYLNADLPSEYQYKGMHWFGLNKDEYSFSKSRMLVRTRT